MLRYFQGYKRILFFPKSWANSVTAWLLSLRSESGTIRVTNTSAPTDARGPSIDVDPDRLAEVAAGALSQKLVSREDASGVDGESIELDGAGRLRVNTQWLDNFVRQRVQKSAQVGQ
jgi:hypothetical protein